MNKKDKILLYMIYGFIIALIVGAIVFVIWALVTYGGKPITEVPSWYLWLMRK